MSKCDSCSHSEVCQYKEEFQSFEQSQSPTDRPFCMVEVNCKYFSSKPYRTLTLDELQLRYGSGNYPFTK
jgi:hypothetical protein